MQGVIPCLYRKDDFMKILKKASQKNIEINTDFYNVYQINEMLDRKLIFYLDEEFNEKYDNISSFDLFEGEYTFRIFTSNLKELKVVLDDGYYTTIAITNEGEKLYVKLT